MRALLFSTPSAQQLYMAQSLVSPCTVKVTYYL